MGLGGFWDESWFFIDVRGGTTKFFPLRGVYHKSHSHTFVVSNKITSKIAF